MQNICSCLTCPNIVTLDTETRQWPQPIGWDRRVRNLNLVNGWQCMHSPSDSISIISTPRQIDSTDLQKDAQNMTKQHSPHLHAKKSFTSTSSAQKRYVPFLLVLTTNKTWIFKKRKYICYFRGYAQWDYIFHQDLWHFILISTSEPDWCISSQVRYFEFKSKANRYASRSLSLADGSPPQVAKTGLPCSQRGQAATPM